MNTRKWLYILAAFVLCISIGAVQAMAAPTYGGNMTAYGPGGGFVAGGTNDVAFEITGPLYTSVPGAGAAMNGTIASDNAFFGGIWTTQVWLYGPGTYTVYDGCAPGNPGCGTGTALTFIVGPGELGGHILFNWGTYSNLDLVTVWSPNTTWATVNGTAPFFTGIDNTPPDGAPNTKDTVFSWVSIKSKGSTMTPEAGDMTDYGPNFNLQVAAPACVPADCNDSNACTTDSCNAGVCEHTNNTASCSDNNACTTGDVCSGGVCGGTAMNCDDSNACTTDTCNAGVCSHSNNNNTCDDNNACTTGDVCSGGVCAGVAMNCDDNNACTTDTCNAGVCVHTNNTASCNDNNACTTGDVCSGGVCAGTAMNCDDSNICTTDGCSAGVCTHTPTVPASCNDNNACTSDGCTANACTHTVDCAACPADPICNKCSDAATRCNDNDACTTDTCDSATGACGHTAISCDDNDICTNDSCVPATGCAHTATVPASCNDNNACTTDGCTANACTHTVDCAACPTDPICDNKCSDAATRCNDNDACTTDTCDSTTGVCGHTAISCDDDNTCTTDSCLSATGCNYAANADGSACTVNNAAGTCTAGVCNPPTVCDGVQSVTIRGGGQKPSSVDQQIQTEFTVVGDGCIVDSTANMVTITPGTTLQINCKAGNGPQPTFGTWKGKPLPRDANGIVCPSTGEAGRLILTNLGAQGGRDTDRMIIRIQ